MACFDGVILLTILTGLCYRSSTKSRTFEKKEHLLEKAKYEQSVKDIEKAQDANY